jgi:hypothetical protein
MFANFFSIYFLLGSLIPGTNFSDLIHIPDMVDHYVLHVEEAALLDEDYSLLKFINDHFINPDEHKQSGHEHEHQNLPLHHVSSTLLITGEYAIVEFPFSLAELNSQFCYIPVEAPGCDKAIFQPPI